MSLNTITACTASAVMDAEVDPRDVAGVGSAELASVVNRFAVATCGFLASFAAECEARLGEQEARMQKAEVALALLEQKLGEFTDGSFSIWGLPDIMSTKFSDFFTPSPSLSAFGTALY